MKNNDLMLGAVFAFLCVVASPLSAEPVKPTSVSPAMDSAKMVAKEAAVETKQETPAEKKIEKIPFKLPVPDNDLDKAEGILKSLEGEVGGQSLRGMAVVYQKDEGSGSKEVWINFNNKVKLKGFKKLSELGYEDKVRIIFKETKDGNVLLRQIELLKKKQEGVLESLERKFIKQETPQL